MRRHLRTVAAVGAGVIAAAGIVVSTVLPHHYKLAVVPRRYAVLTHQQRVILSLARKHGVGSGIYYIWGGTSHGGFDCSGFVWHVLREAGVHIDARTSYAMYSDRHAHHVLRSQLRPGDVLIFNNAGHVGLYLGYGRFVEYYRSGYPARYGRLSATRGTYVGARRWWWPLRIRKRTLYPALYVARRWHLKIAGHSGDTVVFVPHRRHGHLRFPAWKRRSILRWAHHNHHPVHGYFTHINIKLHR